MEQLIELAQEEHLNWKQIGIELDMSGDACRIQYRRICQQPKLVPPAYHWTREELDRLKRATDDIPRTEKHYWKLISEHVGTRSVIACQRKVKGLRGLGLART